MITLVEQYLLALNFNFFFQILKISVDKITSVNVCIVAYACRYIKMYQNDKFYNVN
jgi:hypothetical protein